MPVYPADGLTPDAGELIELEYQYQFGPALMGSGTSIVVEKITGMLGHAETRDQDIEKANSHGSIPGSLLFLPRTIQFDVKVSTQILGDTIEDVLDELSTAFQPPSLRNSRTLQAFAYWRPGRDKRQFFARATKLDFDSDFVVARGMAEASCLLTRATAPTELLRCSTSLGHVRTLGLPVRRMTTVSFGSIRCWQPTRSVG